MVSEFDSTWSRAKRCRTSGVALTDVKREVPRLAVLRAPAVIQRARAAAGNVIELGPEAIHHDRTNDQKGAAAAHCHPVVLTRLVVHLAGPVANAAKTEVRARLRFAVKSKHVGALANGER